MSKDITSLEERFKEFLGGLPDSENLDEILPDGSSKGKKADYLLDQRNIILELKSLQTDPEYKIDQLLEPIRSRPEFPLFYWDADLTDLLRPLHDAEVIHKRIFDAIARSVQTALEKANAQIRSTKLAVEIPGAAGVVVILNENIKILNPRVVTGKVNEMLTKRRSDGSIRYNQIEHVFIISEGHVFSKEGNRELLPLIQVIGPTAQTECSVNEYLGNLQSEWCKYQGIPQESMGLLKDLMYFNFEERGAPDHPQSIESFANHELWRQSYRRKPYLRALTEDQLLDYAVRIISTMAPHLMKGGKKLPQEYFFQLGIGWTHILEEAEFRHLDMKKLQARLPDPSSYVGKSE